MLAEELRERDPLPRRRRVDWYGGRGTTTTSPLRLGLSASVPSTSRAPPCGRTPRHDLLARIGRIGQALEGGDDLIADPLVLGGRHIPRGRGRRG